MKKVFLIFIMMFCFGRTAEAVTLFGLTFDEYDFADDITHVSGDIAYYDYAQSGKILTGDDNIDLDTVLAGHDLLSNIEGAYGIPGVHSTKSAYTIEVEFLNNYLFNGPGADLAVWERGFAEPFYMALWNPITNNWTSGAMFATTAVGSIANSIDTSPGVNVAQVDFSFWGIPSGTHISKARFWSDQGDPNADLAAFGGLNSDPVNPGIPEPSTLILLGLGLILTGCHLVSTRLLISAVVSSS